ncbi:hypothetical protein [Marivita sp. GX14005]|uniref:hypothetical protein n=1 Tax=Marivita sp. GX14005 TaxID=2942276 RepID=UPI002018C4AE|nr:hypothetical protein [Marivita sp. GX14005]MCL3883187.1 hypothetical protein [Marivita sp. GX14005]
MRLDPVRKTCGNCNETLPRAARGRCPVCLAPISQGAVAHALCAACKMPVPRAHAGQCPSCAAPIVD